MGCEERIAALVDLAEGSLDGAAKATLEAHLAGCAGCREELAVLRGTGDLLAATRDEPHDLTLSGFAARTTDRAEAFRDRSARGLFWSTTRAARWALGLSAAALACALVVARTTPGPSHRLPAAPAAVPASVDVAADDADSTDDAFASDDFVDVGYDAAFDGLSTDELDTLDQLLDQNPT